MGGAGNGIGRPAHATPKTPTPTLPKGRECCLMQTISRWHSASYELKAKRQKLQATFLFRLPSLGRRPQAGGGCLSGSRLWAVGGGQAMHRHRTYCPSNDYNPTPALPIGEGVPSDASHEPQAFLRPRTTIHKLQTTGHRLQATCCFSSIPRTRPACRPRSGVHAGREAEALLSLTRKRWNVGEGFKPSPTG